MASQSPLLVEKQAYSERAGHARQLPQSFERSETTTNQHHVEVVEDQQNAVCQQAVVVVIDERDSELVHPIGRGLCSGNLRHSDELDTFTLSPRQPSLKNNRNHLLNGDWRLDDGRRCFKISGSNALPVGQGRRGEEVDVMEEQVSELVVVEEMGAVLGKPRRSDELDANALSERQSNLKNNRIHCSMNENVSKQQAAPPVLPPAVRTICVPDAPKPTHSKTRNDLPHGPPVAVLSSHPRFHKESPCHHLEGTKLCQNDKVYFSMNKDVSKRWTVPLAPSPYTQVKDIPVSQDQTQSQTCYKSLYSPQLAVSPFHQRFLPESCLRHLDGVELGLSNAGHCSVRKIVSNRRVACTAPPSLIPTRSLPCSQRPMPSIACKDPSHGPPMAVSSFCPQSLKDLHQRRLGDAQGCCNDERHRSVKKDVSRQRTVHPALSPIAEVRGLPVTQALTRPYAHYKPSYGPQMAVASIYRRFYKESPGQHLDNAGLFQIDEMRCSVKDHVSK
jgi:hypothetical protein